MPTDRTHILAISSVWVMPSPSGNKAITAVLGGWQMTGILTANSGAPLKVSTGVDRSLNGQGLDTADLIELVALPGGDTVATDRYFVTASHCSSSRNSLDYSDSYQHGDIVANEWGDPAAFTNSYTSSCPVGKLCRFADASVYRYNDPSLDDQNHVALAGIGSLSFTSVATITSVDSPPVGYTVNMIGAKSGRRYATVEATCEDVFNIAGWTNGALLCQGRAAYFSQDGDSGAPVIELFGDGTAWAVGIHWGNYTSGGVLHSRFSPMDNVLNEFYTRLPGSPYFSPVQY